MSPTNGSVSVLYHCPLNYKVQLPYMQDMQLIVSLIDHWDGGYDLNLRAEEDKPGCS